MTHEQRRRYLSLLGAALVSCSLPATRSTMRPDVFTLVTFGDSILDCAGYNAHGVHPGQLLVRNDDRLFPEFAGRDLSAYGPARLDHRATDGAAVTDLPRQLKESTWSGPGAALLTIGGNDLLGGLAADRGTGMARFEARLDDFLRTLPVRPVLIGNVYDPTFGDDARNFLATNAGVARASFRRMNAVLSHVAERHGQLIDIHGHFLAGDPTWFTRTIEPSLRGASEVRAAFLPALMKLRT